MAYILEGFLEAFKLIFSGDSEIYQIIGLSLIVSSLSTALAALIGIPLGIGLGLKNFKFKKTFSQGLYTLMGVPPVVAGLMVGLLIARRGPLGDLDLRLTPTAMVIAQTLLVLPIIMGNIYNNVKETGPEVLMSLKTLGAGKWDTLKLLILEMRRYILIALVAGFGRAISEVGAVLIVGGNIQGKTRVMTTYIALNYNMGNNERAIAMGLILLAIAFLINGLVYKYVLGDDFD